MAKAKRECRCNKCGGVISAGEDISFSKVDGTLRDGRGFRCASTTRFYPIHANNSACEAETMRADIEYVNMCDQQGILPNMPDSRLREVRLKMTSMKA